MDFLQLYKGEIAELNLSQFLFGKIVFKASMLQFIKLCKNTLASNVYIYARYTVK